MPEPQPVYLEYRTIDGYVVAIHETMPLSTPEGYAVAESAHFVPGDEFTYYIKVYVDEIKDGKVTSHAAVRQAPPAQEILQRLAQLEREKEDIRQKVTALESKVK